MLRDAPKRYAGEVSELEGRRAFVTGGARGIGAGIARALAYAGADVAINFRANDAAADNVADEVRALGRRAIVCRGDVGEAEDCARMAEQALADFGGIDVFVHNAGVFSMSRRRSPLLLDQDASNLVALFGVHALGAFHLCKHFVPGMRARKTGSVVVISSESVRFPGPGRGPYSMAKAALEMFASTLAKEERRYGIRVNTVSPGFVDTDMARAAWAAMGRSMEQVIAKSPFGFVCTAEDIGNAVVFLCSERARYITGVVLQVSGDRFASGAT